MKNIMAKIGLARLIIVLFLLFLLVMAVILEVPLPALFSNILVRFGMNAVLVLAMVPAVQSGIGLNFNLPLGIICGLLGALVSIEFNFTGFTGLLVAMLVSLPLAIVSGYGYGHMLNRIKGQEMTVGTYVGFSIVSLMSIFWQILPFTSTALIWAYGGSGLRVTISLDAYLSHVLNDFLAFEIAGTVIPTGLLLFFAFTATLVWLFGKSKRGLAMQVAGSNEKFALANGINVDKERIMGTILSTVLAAVGIIVYSQAFGFLQLYTAPLYAAIPAVAAILIGGASLQRAKIIHVVIGTMLFQSLLVVALPIINIMAEGNLAEVVRAIVSNGIILYALTRTGGEAV